MQEVQTNKVKSRLTLNDAAAVLRLFVVYEDREIDPIEIRMEASAPDDISHWNSSAILEQWQAISDADDARYAAHACSGEIARLDANQRSRLMEHTGSDSASQRGLHGQQTMEDHSQDERLHHFAAK